MHPGSKLVKFTPTKVGELLDKCGARALYNKFEAEISDDCGGKAWHGWDSHKIQEKVDKYQEDFKAKGIGVTYSTVSWCYYVAGGPPAWGGQMVIEYRYWMAYADLSIAADYKPVDAFDPQKDYDHPPHDEKGDEKAKSPPKQSSFKLPALW